MNKIGIRAHDLGKFDDCFKLAHKVKSHHFDGLQLVFKKALNYHIDFDHLSDIKNAFNDLELMMLGAYFNPVHPNEKIVEDGIKYFKKHLEIANTLNAKYVGTETGSLMGTPWGYVEENHLKDTLYKVITIFNELTKYAKRHHTTIALEGAYNHVVYSPLKVREVLDFINSEHLKVTVDLFNFLHIGNYEKRMDILEDCFKYLKEDIVIFHLKDFVIKEDQLVQVGLGQGIMDYETIIQRIIDEVPNAYLIFEGITGDDIVTSLKLIKSLFI